MIVVVGEIVVENVTVVVLVVVVVNSLCYHYYFSFSYRSFYLFFALTR